MVRKVIIEGKVLEAHRLASTDFIYTYALPDEAEGPFCFLDRCGKYYNTEMPRTPPECTATLTWKLDRHGSIDFALGMRSTINPLWWSQRGEVAAVARLG
jgi:hypothetical protein